MEDAALAVAHFGGAVGSAVKAVKSLLERGRGAEAAERIRSMEELSAHAAAMVKEAVRAASRDPALAGRAAKLHEHLVEIRAHFRSFVSGLSGLESKEGSPDRGRGGEQPGHPSHRPGGRRGPRAQGDLVDEVLRGIDDGRVFADRGPHRGERPDHEQQEVDPAAIDTWIGSGEGVKLFSDVFGPFLPARGEAHRGGRHHRRRERGSPGGHEPPRHERPGGERPGRKRGFFARVFQRVEDFAEGVAHVAHAGAGLLGKTMHYAETGMHGLNVIEHAAENVHGLADRAEGFLLRLHLGSAAGFAHQVGSAAGWMDERHWVKRFAGARRPGAYLRVLREGAVAARRSSPSATGRRGSRTRPARRTSASCCTSSARPTTATAPTGSCDRSRCGSVPPWTSRAASTRSPKRGWSSSWAATSPESACTSDPGRRRSPAATRRRR